MPHGSPGIVVFWCQTSWRYSDRGHPWQTR